ncbi:MAG: hypothetical protein JWO65_160 [Sphingomonas bacterium]|nr:hypothetical protein [Sphingomonas bacterium]
MRSKLNLLVTAIGLATLPAMAAYAEARSDGPRSILISYRTDAAKRPAFRRYLAHEEMARLAQWKRQGVIAGYQILFNPFETEDTWDAMLVLRFQHFTDTAKWIAVERDNPGGLDAAGFALGKPFNTYSADVDWEGGEDNAAADKNAIFYVIPYEYRNATEYHNYFEGYVLPQVKWWMQTGILSGYRIFMNRYQVGKPWDALFVYRYRDLAAFGQREATVAKVREGLQSNADWVKWSQNKGDIRTESENAIAEAVQPN